VLACSALKRVYRHFLASGAEGVPDSSYTTTAGGVSAADLAEESSKHRTPDALAGCGDNQLITTLDTIMFVSVWSLLQSEVPSAL